jgi:hypothetical protein
VVARHRDEVPDADERGRGHGDLQRAYAVARPPGGDLHARVRDEQRGRQEPDRGQADAVDVREIGGDAPEVADVPPQRDAEDAPCERAPWG